MTDDKVNVIPWEKAEKIECGCGFRGRLGDLLANDDDTMWCPRCGSSGWMYA